MRISEVMDAGRNLLREYKLPVLATCSALLMWYWMLLWCQRNIKYKLKDEYQQKGKKFDRYYGKDPRMLSIDRIVINTQEQMMPFLCSLWLHAIFVSANIAGILGFSWVLFRIFYSFLMPKSLEKIQPKTVYLATGPQYLIVGYLFLTTMYHAFIS